MEKNPVQETGQPARGVKNCLGQTGRAFRLTQPPFDPLLTGSLAWDHDKNLVRLIDLHLPA
jgi:hypothetical protein